MSSSKTASAASLLGLGVVLTLIATVIAGPLLVRPVIRVLGGAFPALFGSVGRMSQRNALRNPRRTGATAAALMVGLALVGGMSVASASMSKSFDEQIDKTLGADFVVQNANFTPFSQEVTDAVRDTEGVGLVVRQRFAPLAVRLPDGKRVETTASGYDDQVDDVAHITYAQGDTAAALADGAIGMDVDFAKDHGVRLGSVLPVEFPGERTTSLKVGALTDQDGGDGFGMQGGLFLGIATVEKYVPGGQDSALYVNAASGTSGDQLRPRLEKTLDAYPQVQARDQADYKKLVHDQIAVLLYLVYALLGLAIVIAVLGVVNTLALSVVERTREIGLLRAIGLGLLAVAPDDPAGVGGDRGLRRGAGPGARAGVGRVHTAGPGVAGHEGPRHPVGHDRRGRGGLRRRRCRGGPAARAARLADERTGSDRARVTRGRSRARTPGAGCPRP